MGVHRQCLVGLAVVATVAIRLILAVQPPGSGPPQSLCELPVCQCPPLAASIRCKCNPKIQHIFLVSYGTDYLPKSVGSIEIQDCIRVKVTARSIKDIHALRSITLNNIGTIELEEEAFFWNTTRYQESYINPGLVITISNSSIPIIPSESFKGHLHSVVLDRVNIVNIRSLAFSNIAEMSRIEMLNCKIDSVEPQAFKKFILDSFIIKGGNMNTVPSYTINGVQIRRDLKFENVKFDYIRSSAIKVTGPTKFSLDSCKISHLDGEAFRIAMNGPSFVSDNTIKDIGYGAFAGIHLDMYSGKQELVFENNTLTKFVDYALLFNTSGIIPRIERIVINNPCTCNDIKIWTTKLVKFSNSKINVNIAKLMWCNKGRTDAVVEEYNLKHCTSNAPQVYWVVSILIVVLISLLCICSIGFWIFRKHSKRYMNVPTHENNRLSVLSTASNHIIVIPESKIYRETELHVMTESVETIKDYVPPQQLTQTT